MPDFQCFKVLDPTVYLIYSESHQKSEHAILKNVIIGNIYINKLNKKKILVCLRNAV